MLTLLVIIVLVIRGTLVRLTLRLLLYCVSFDNFVVLFLALLSVMACAALLQEACAVPPQAVLSMEAHNYAKSRGPQSPSISGDPASETEYPLAGPSGALGGPLLEGSSPGFATKAEINQ